MPDRIVLIPSDKRPWHRIAFLPEIAAADKVITTDGLVIKDRLGWAPRRAEPHELHEAARHAEGIDA